MESLEKQFKILDLMAEHERAIGSLYEAYKDRFPEMAEFWGGISGEEKIHARWLDDIRPKVERHLVYVDAERFSEQGLRESLEYIAEEKAELDKGDYTPKNALAASMHIENALIDSKNLEIFSTDSAELKHFLDFLKEETENHKKIILEKIESFKNQENA